MFKKRFPIILILLPIIVTGCGAERHTLPDSGMTGRPYEVQESHQTEEVIAEVCHDIYGGAIMADKPDSLEVIQKIVNHLGEMGYAAVDSENQVDMTNAEHVKRFCKQVDAEEEAEMTIIVVAGLGGFTEYDFHTKDGSVDIVRRYYRYMDGRLDNTSTGTYRADLWQYTDEGYLLFEGTWQSEEYYVLVGSGVPEHIALRVEPLNEKCRELNRQYLLPIGYGQNNMFLVDWSEDDFGELDFYDLFDIFYPLVTGRAVPYTADDDLNTGAVYRIAKEEFEAVVMSYLNIDSETLRSMTIYLSEDDAYEYRPRGFYEAEYPEMPYPEVVGYKENDDGTMTLTVNAVYPNETASKVYAHEVVVRPLDGGGVQYVSNRIIPSDKNIGQTWHVPRLTKERWEEVYGEQEHSRSYTYDTSQSACRNPEISESIAME